jgi:uncharacterized protein with PQ loop repeat
MTSLLGYIGGGLLAVCALPETIRTLKDKTCHLGWGFLLLWFFGEVFMLIYGLGLKDLPLILNYGINLVLIGPMLWYKIKARGLTN